MKAAWYSHNGEAVDVLKFGELPTPQPAAGEVRVTLSGAAGQCEVQIADNGPGMAPEFIRDRLFKPFDSTKGSKGMGIGAYQARAYVQQQRGSIEVQSSPAQGTRFTIRLPLCQTTNSDY